MDKEPVFELYHSLDSEIEELLTADRPVLLSLTEAIDTAKRTLMHVHALFAAQPESEQAGDVCYYKTLYPMFNARLVFLVEYYNIERAVQLMDRSAAAVFLQEELAAIERYFRKNYLLFEYYKLGATDLDRLYFLPHSGGHSLLLPETVDLNPAGIPGACQVFSCIIAYETLREKIRSRIGELSIAAIQPELADSKKLSWTGDSIDLVELAYGLHLSGQVGHGYTSLNRIVQWLSASFSVDLSHVSRRFTEISRRKRLSYTRFIDQMREAVQRKIQNSQV